MIPRSDPTGVLDVPRASLAARIVKPLLIQQEDLESLIGEARAREPASWRVEEKKMIAHVAKAWELLAPLGVETMDIRRLVDGAVRNA